MMQELRRLAKLVDENFDDVTVIIDSSDRQTLIVHTYSESMADKVDLFLRDRGARTEREWHDDSDIRVLALPS